MSCNREWEGRPASVGRRREGPTPHRLVTGSPRASEHSRPVADNGERGSQRAYRTTCRTGAPWQPVRPWPPMSRLVPIEGGVSLAVADEGAGPAVVLMHGWPVTAYHWRHTVPALVAAGYRAITVELRGLGGTSVGSGPFDKETLAAGNRRSPSGYWHSSPTGPGETSGQRSHAIEGWRSGESGERPEVESGELRGISWLLLGVHALALAARNHQMWWSGVPWTATRGVAGWRGRISNLRSPDPESGALPLGHSPVERR